MRVAKNYFHVKVDSQFVQPKVKGWDLDTDFNPKRLATKRGVVTCLPVVVEGYINDSPIELGDEIIFDHLVCQDENKVGENEFRCEYCLIYAKVAQGFFLARGVVIPIEDVFFALPNKEQSHPTVTWSSPKISNKYAQVHSISKTVHKEGLLPLDTVFFTKNADYEIEIDGTIFYKMRLRNVIGIERGGKLTPFGNKLLVKNVTTLGKCAGFEKIYAQSSLQHGVVINGGATGIQAGEELTYFNTMASAVTWNGEEYSFIREEHIKYIKDMTTELKARPVRDRLLILQDEGQGMSMGFEIPDSEKKKPFKGTVVAVGTGFVGSDGKVTPMTVKVGDQVIYSKFATTTVEIEGKEYVCIKEGDLEVILD